MQVKHNFFCGCPIRNLNHKSISKIAYPSLITIRLDFLRSLRLCLLIRIPWFSVDERAHCMMLHGHERFPATDGRYTLCVVDDVKWSIALGGGGGGGREEQGTDYIGSNPQWFSPCQSKLIFCVRGGRMDGYHPGGIRMIWHGQGGQRRISGKLILDLCFSIQLFNRA